MDTNSWIKSYLTIIYYDSLYLFMDVRKGKWFKNDLSMKKYSLDLSILLSEGIKRNTNILSSSERTVFRSASKIMILSLSIESEQQNSLNIKLESLFKWLNHRQW